MKPETALKKINDTLFPKPIQVGRKDFVSSNTVFNLEGALIDLKRTGADKVCIKTVERVQKQIVKVARILEQAGYDTDRF